MQRDDSALLLDIVAASRLILQFKAGMSFEDFRGDWKTRSAVIHQLMVIGEAAKRLSGEFKAMHSGIPWPDIARMRDKMIHHYEEVNLQLIWIAADKDIPDLLVVLEPLLPPSGKTE